MGGAGRSGNREGKIDRRPARGRDDESHRVAAERFAAAVARVAPSDQISPRPPHERHSFGTGTSERNRDTVEGLARRQVQFRRQPATGIAVGGRGDKTRAHPFDSGVQRRKVDPDFVVEPSARPRKRHRQHPLCSASVVTRANRVVPHRPSYDRFAPAGCQGETAGVSITPAMEQRECPVCGEHMRLQTREQTDRVPGTREVKTRAVREWVCPECDHFEEVEES